LCGARYFGCCCGADTCIDVYRTAYLYLYTRTFGDHIDEFWFAVAANGLVVDAEATLS
jgi:hypothetical protein